ncbi:30S ribosomal protein S9, partial [Patescibacteria group bacterium]|nr:30S ribosomal protein S9 [Patescibacteria group bacterium]
VKVVGSGKYGQLDALIHGLSRALTLANPDFRPLLKKRGLLTRDPRTRQRRMIGKGGKSRRKKQSPKR